jgi:hypothetical protein
VSAGGAASTVTGAIEQLDLPPSAAPASHLLSAGGKGGAAGTSTPLSFNTATTENSNRPSEADSSMADMDSLPITDTQKARIVSRQ